VATFEQALEELYAEAWDAGEKHSEWVDRLQKKEEDPTSSEMSLERLGEYVESTFQVAVGTRHSLGRVLALKGEVGTRAVPATGLRKPDGRQTWIRLAQWGVAKGLEKQEALIKVLTGDRQYRVAAANLGRNYEHYEDQIGPVLDVV
jgi:hypothetical protein